MIIISDKKKMFVFRERSRLKNVILNNNYFHRSKLALSTFSNEPG